MTARHDETAPGAGGSGYPGYSDYPQAPAGEPPIAGEPPTVPVQRPATEQAAGPWHSAPSQPGPLPPAGPLPPPLVPPASLSPGAPIGSPVGQPSAPPAHRGAAPGQPQHTIAIPPQPGAPTWDPYPARPQSGPPQLAVPVKARRTWPGTFAFIIAILLLLVAGGEAYWVNQLQADLKEADRREAAAQESDKTRIDALERRVSDLETQLGSRFDSAEIAAAVLPSVFRVVAGDFVGT